MDRRIGKTKRSIYDAFLEIRAKKSLEKLTVKELCERAQINKSTFYTYYHDVYDLSDRIESEIVASIVQSLVGAPDMIIAPKMFTHDLFMAYTAQASLISVVFSGSRTEQLPKKIEETLKDMLAEVYPDMEKNVKMNIALAYSVYGGYYAYREGLHYGAEQVVALIGELAEKVMK